MAPLTWLVTGCSSGLGEQFVRDILARGDKVVATARNGKQRLQGLKKAGALVYDLDVTAPKDKIFALVSKIIEEIGGLDVLLNNAGYGELGLVEEISDEALLANFNTNFVGPLHMIQAVLPHFRAKRSGTIVHISSIAGKVVVLPGTVAYNVSKAALESLHDVLVFEVAPLGIRSLIFEPGYFATKVFHNMKRSGQEAKSHAPELGQDKFNGDYIEASKVIQSFAEDGPPYEPGDLDTAVRVMVDVVKREGTGAVRGGSTLDRLPIGEDSLGAIRGQAEDTLRDLALWGDVAARPSTR